LKFFSEYVTKLMKEVQKMPEEVVKFVSNMYRMFTEIELENNEQLIYE